MPAATDVAEAKLWCSEARRILKKARVGKSERSRFGAANKEIEKLLARLLPVSAKLHGDCEQEYLTLAGEAKAAAENDDKKKVEQASQQLTALVAKIKQHLENKKRVDAGLKKFDEAFARLESEVADAGGLRDAQTPASSVKQALDDAHYHMDQAWTLRESAEATIDLAELEKANRNLEEVKSHLKAAKEQAKLAEEHARHYLAAMKRWGELQPLVRAALQELRTLPGAGDFADDLQDKFNAASAAIKSQNGVWSGHDEAVKKVEDYAQIVATARKASTTHLAKDIPRDVMTALEKAIEQLSRHTELAPPYAAAGYRDEAYRLAESGRTDANQAVTDLTTLTATVKTEADRLQLEKQQAVAEASNFDDAVKALVTLGVPTPLYAASKRLGDMAKEGDLADRQWAATATRLKSATAELTEIDAAYQKDGQAWEAKRKELRSIHDKAGDLVNFPAVAQAANRLREAAHELLVRFESYDFAGCLDAAAKATVGRPPKTLAAALQELESNAKNLGVPDDPDDREEFLEDLREAAKEVEEAAAATRVEFGKRIEKIKDLAPRARDLLSAHWEQRTVAIEAAWKEYRSTAAGDKKQLTRETEKATKALKDLLSEQRKMKQSALDQLLQQLGQANEAQVTEQAAKWIRGALQELTESGEDVSAEQQELDDELKKPQPSLRDLSDRVEVLLAASRKAQAEDQLKTKTELHDEVEKPLRKLKISETYRAELEKDSLDVRSLVDTNDPYLLEIAKKKKQQLKDHIDALAKNPELYETNKQRTAALADRIGDLLKEMPETQRRLKTAVTDLIVESKHMEPAAMVKQLDELEREVDQAETDAAKRKREIERYDKLKEEVKKKFGDMKKLTQTRVTEKSEAFETYYEARLEEASGHKARESGIPQAMDVLNKLEKMLDDILGAENPRAQLRELDAQQQQDQRLVKDMAAQFERELGIFNSVTLPEAKAVAKESDDGDTNLVKSLKGVASAAAKIVSPYLKNNYTLPHQKRGAQPSPEMNQMKADFERARNMLADATRTAQRLIQAPATTNVKGPQQDGLRKIQQKWRERTQAYDAAIREVAKAIRAAAAGETDPTTIANAEKAAKTIDGLAGHFRGEAFASSFKELMEPLPNDKRQAEKAQRQRLAQREAALRVMRQYRTDLTRHPLLTKITDKKRNPFEAPTMMAAAAGLRTLLKEVELQVLDSV